MKMKSALFCEIARYNTSRNFIKVTYMKKIVLLFGTNIIPNFEPHIHELDSSLCVIECDYASHKSIEYPNQHLALIKGKEFKEIKKLLKGSKLVAVINRKDYFEKLHGKIVDYYNIPGPSSAAIDQISNKANFHKLMLDLNLDMFRPRTISCHLSEVPKLLKSLQFPVIIKPFAGAHSRGVYKLDNAEDFKDIQPKLYAHFQKELAVNILSNNEQTVLIEEYLPGKMVVPICYVDKKHKVHFISLVKAVAARDLNLDHYQLIYRTTPTNVKESIQQKMRFILQKISKATLLKETFLDPEFFVKDNNVYLIEVNVRMGGFRYHLAKAAFDIDLNKMITEIALDREVDDQINTVYSATACEIWSSRSGKVKSIKLPRSKKIIWQRINMNPGDRYLSPPQGDKSLGSYYVKSKENSLRIAKKIRNKMVIEFE